MASSLALTPLSTTLDPFKYVGGDPALDFVNTVDWTSRGLVRDRLTSYERLVAWAEGAGVVSRDAARALLAAGRSTKQRDAALASCRQLRATLQRVFAAVASNRVDAEALTELNRFVELALAQRTLVYGGAKGRARRAHSHLDWAWRDGDSLDVILWTVTWRAATLLVSPDAHRLRVCGGDDCGWMFVDRSRNGLRRWCEMDVCGMKEKNRRRGARSGRRSATRSVSPSRSRRASPGGGGSSSSSTA
jgi:predicted RNA-binding Zn ribbon-like protein